MNRKLLLYGLLVVIGLADALLNIWLYLLERETMPLLQAAIGILIVIVGVVQIRRERAIKRENG